MTVDAEKLVRMGEQITANMNYGDDSELVIGKIANHLERFWDPRMKAALLAYAADHSEQLSPLLRAAVSRL